MKDEAKTGERMPTAGPPPPSSYFSHSPSSLDPAALVSTLPTDDPDFAEIVAEFAGRLDQQLAAIRAAWEQRELGELASLAHWLKGSGGMAGFRTFTAPAAERERRAEAGRADPAQPDDVATTICESTDLASRIAVSDVPADRAGT
jgi:HPt (histidine-containing phosphotransfer) domain-containing protein